MKTASILLLVSICLYSACRPTVFAKTYSADSLLAKQAMPATPVTQGSGALFGNATAQPAQPAQGQGKGQNQTAAVVEETSTTETTAPAQAQAETETASATQTESESATETESESESSTETDTETESTTESGSETETTVAEGSAAQGGSTHTTVTNTSVPAVTGAQEGFQSTVTVTQGVAGVDQITAGEITDGMTLKDVSLTEINYLIKSTKKSMTSFDIKYGQKYLTSALPPVGQRPQYHYGRIAKGNALCYGLVTQLGYCVGNCTGTCSGSKCVAGCVLTYQNKLRIRNKIDWTLIIKWRTEVRKRNVLITIRRIIQTCSKACRASKNKRQVCYNICIHTFGERIITFRTGVVTKCVKPVERYTKEIDQLLCENQHTRESCLGYCTWAPTTNTTKVCSLIAAQFEKQCTTGKGTGACATIIGQQSVCGYANPRQGCTDECEDDYQKEQVLITQKITAWKREQELIIETRRRQEEAAEQTIEDEHTDEEEQKVKVERECVLKCQDNTLNPKCLTTCIASEGKKVPEAIKVIHDNCEAPSLPVTFKQVIAYRKCYATYQQKVCLQECLTEKDAAQPGCREDCSNTYKRTITIVEHQSETYTEITKQIAKGDFNGKEVDEICPTTCETAECLKARLEKLEGGSTIHEAIAASSA